MPPRVYSSVKEAWAGFLSGAAPTTRRRVSCSTIDVLSRGGDTSTNSVVDSASSSKNDLPRTTETSKALSSEKSYDELDDEQFECKVFVQLSDEEDKDNNKNQVDIGSLSDEDLRRLKRDDPFLYYSIPSIRRRSYRFDDVDEEEEGRADAIRNAMTRMSTTRRPTRRTSLPAQVLANADISRSQRQQQEEVVATGLVEEVLTVMIEEPSRRSSVTRCRRLSTEAHPSMVCDDLLRELEEIEDEDEDEDDIDMDLDLAQLERELSEF